MAKEKATQIWKFTPSQILLLQEQARLHAEEHAPLNAYQSRAQNDLLIGFKEEFGIPEAALLAVDLNTMQFTERQPETLAAVPETDDLDPDPAAE